VYCRTYSSPMQFELVAVLTRGNPLVYLGAENERAYLEG
jgi:hypothetical protein